MDFEEWKKSWEVLDDELFDRNKFVRDGVVCNEAWEDTLPKVLFILKEPNGPQDIVVREGETDLAASLKEGGKNAMKFGTWRNINNWAYGLINTSAEGSLPSFEEATSSKEISLNKVAIINIKKAYGGSVAKFDELKKFACEDKELLLMQIEEIDPDIIVTCNVYSLLREYVIPKEDSIKSTLKFSVNNTICDNEWVEIWNHYSKITNKSKEILIIRHYHPNATRAQNKGLSEETKYQVCCEIRQKYLQKQIK